MIFRIKYHNTNKNGNNIYRVYGYKDYSKTYFNLVSKNELGMFFIGSRYNNADGSYTTLKSPNAIIKTIEENCRTKNITPKIIIEP